MSAYRVFTDSTSDLTPELIEELDLSVIPMEFTIEEKTYFHYADEREIGFHEFYEKVRAGSPATTAQVSPARFHDAFAPTLAAGEDILYLLFSSGLSGMANSAHMAAQELMEEYPERRVVVVDTLSASMGEGLLVYHTVLQKRAGKSLDEAAQWAEENKLRLCHWFTVDDLNHLKRGGRLSPTAAFVGTMLGIKPVLHVDHEGHLIPVEKVRGRKQSLNALVDHMVETCENPEEQMIFVSHGDAPEDAQYVAEQVRERFQIKDLTINFIGPIVGAHSGPGTVALFFLGSKR